MPIVFTYSHDGEWLQQPKSERTAAARVADNQSGDDSRQALPSGIAAAIQKYAERLKVYFAPNIPDSQMQTGILEIHEQALALIDLKRFGSSANYIVFTQTRLYINSNRGGFSGSLKYSELTKTKLLPNNQGVLVGEGRLVDVGWKNSDILFELFKELRRVSP